MSHERKFQMISIHQLNRIKQKVCRILSHKSNTCNILRNERIC